jgi:general stress protein 26
LITPEQQIQKVLHSSRFAVLATQNDGQPHTSRMAFTPLEGVSELVIATYRNTLKYRSLSKDGRVAFLIEYRTQNPTATDKDVFLTGHGSAAELQGDKLETAIKVHQERHPQMSAFLAAEDCVLLGIKVSAYEVVLGIDDVIWHQVKDIQQ